MKLFEKGEIVMSKQEMLLDRARDFFNQPDYRYWFTENEARILNLFFTNLDKRVFFIHSLPESVICTALSMYSRLKNARGLRGIFVDAFVPNFLASTFREVEERFNGEPDKFLSHYKLATLDKFLGFSDEARASFQSFCEAFAINPTYMREFSQSSKVQRMTNLFLDKYGHNSIARMGKVALGAENVSILAAKSMEWTRPGAGYIELSTRYVDMSGKDIFDLSWLWDVYGVSEKLVRSAIETSFGYYKDFQGVGFSGPFPNFLREEYQTIVANSKDLENGVIGETCDVLGNFLPCATLTSLGIVVSGEAFPQLLKHLILDKTPENSVILEMILEEASKVGANVFARHYEPTPWELENWEYLGSASFFLGPSLRCRLIPRVFAEEVICSSVIEQDNDHSVFGRTNFDHWISNLAEIPRGDFDRLPYHFEKVCASFSGKMSFRGWRDLQRQQLATHARTYVDPALGFYNYDKPAPEELREALYHISVMNALLYQEMCWHNVQPELGQYPLAMGNLVGFQFGANLREIEFCNWQRSKFDVNHEVRQVFLKMEEALRQSYPWWERISRANMTSAYAFARTKEGIPL